MSGCTNSEPAPFLAGVLRLWWVALAIGVYPYGSRPNYEPGSLIFNTKTKNNNTKAFVPLNLVLGLYILPAYPKPGLTLFATSIILLHKTAGTIQGTSSPQLLLCEPKADKTHKKIFINSLESREEIGIA